MSTSQGYTTLDTVIREIILNEGRTTLHKYLWYLSYALKANRQFTIDDSKEFKTTKLVMDNKKSVKFPTDLIQWNKIALVFRDRTKVFVPDETIALTFDKEGAVYQPNAAWTSDREWDISFFNYGGYGDNDGAYSNLTVHGKAYNGIGYYRMNEACREIQFSADVDQCSVYVEYVANCNSPCNKMFVPIIAMDMIQESIQYYNLKYKHGESDKRTVDQFLTWERERMRYKSRIVICPKED